MSSEYFEELKECLSKIKESVSTRAVVESCGHAVNRYGKCICPFHDDSHPSMKVDSRYHCFVCGADGDGVEFVQRLYGLDLYDAAASIISTFGLSIILPEKQESKVRKPVPPKKVEMKKVKDDYDSGYEPLPAADIEVRNNTNRHILNMMPMDQRTIDDLVRRGCTPEEAKSMNYGTFVNIANVGEQLQREGCQVRAVAGMYFDQNHWSLRRMKEGTLLPFVDREQRISCFHVGVFDRSKGGKYIYLSSNRLCEGSMAVPICHYAMDFCYDLRSRKMKPIIHGDSVRITEGILKGDLIHLFSGEDVIAIAGIRVIADLPDTLNYLKSRGVKRIIDTFDMDYITNEDVAKASKDLKNLVLAAGLRYERLDWDVHPVEGVNLKGYDDYLAWERTKK